MRDIRCPPWRAKRRRVVPGSREATRDTRRAEGAKGDPKGHPNAASSHMGDRCVAATSLRCCGGTPGDQDGRGTNELSKIESILGTRMSQNLSRDRRLAWIYTPGYWVFRHLGESPMWRLICPKGKSSSTWNGKRVHSHVARPVASRRQVTTRAVVAGATWIRVSTRRSWRPMCRG